MKAAANIESCPAFWQMQMLQLPFSGWVCITGCTLNANHENLWSVIMMFKWYHKAGIHRSWVPGCHGVFFIIASRIFFILFWKFYIFAYFYITFSNLWHVVLILSWQTHLMHPTHSGLKQGATLSPLLFSFSLQLAIGEVWEKDCFELNGRYQFCMCADGVCWVKMMQLFLYFMAYYVFWLLFHRAPQDDIAVVNLTICWTDLHYYVIFIVHVNHWAFCTLMVSYAVHRCRL